ncbi:uncharacterized protein LOC9648635 [Selaginella moellendorffii]|nr:uncharacterized protein LOC9648635 [Selaginella moellendorffii]|eukprot:XP_002976442.2 uncharacterized protein LOC9648635 [Selaginella moellendorffii]
MALAAAATRAIFSSSDISRCIAESSAELCSARGDRGSSARFSQLRLRASISPFTEKDSIKKVRGGGRLEFRSGGVENSCPGCREETSESSREEENDIATRLPELREVLELLRRQRKKEEGSDPSSPSKRWKAGNVFLVGTGPGDPELLTLKAVRLMRTADLVLYDRLVSTSILDMVHEGAKLLYVGKTSGYHSRTQDEIHELLLNFAEAGATVLRLKGGDPLVFGRGGEEMDFLQEQGIAVTVVPGITAASGIAAGLGIPLTHRGVANSVRFLTGHARKGGKDPLYVAEQAADPDSTLVIYMGLATLPALAERFIANGLPPDTPAAAIERGTTEQQRTVFAELANLPSEVAATQLVSPTLIFIGRVVALSPLWPERSTPGSARADENEPRDRSSRGPDPVLPSQLSK